MNKRKNMRKGPAAGKGLKGAEAFKPKAKAADRLQMWVATAKAAKECAILTAEAVRDVSRLMSESEKIVASAADARRINHAVSVETATPVHNDIGDAVVAAKVSEIKLASEISLSAVRGSAAIVAAAVTTVVDATIGNRDAVSALSALVAQEMKAALRRKKLQHDATEARLEHEVVKARKGGDEG